MEDNWCECLGQEKHPKCGESKIDVSLMDWHHIVEQYTLLDLSFHKDRLPAIAGVAKRVGEARGWRYIAGLWLESLRSDLLWTVQGRLNIKPRPTPLVAPTWSWASVNSGVEWKCWDDTRSFVHFLQYDIRPAGPDVYDELKFAQLKISGLVVLSTMHYGLDWADIKLGSLPHPRDPYAKHPKEELTMNEGFGLLVDRHSYVLGFGSSLDYLVQAPGSGHIESGSEVILLILGTTNVVNWVLREVEHKDRDRYRWSGTLALCLILRCVDKERCYYERIGTFEQSTKIVFSEWIRNLARRTELNLC
jgi:hypothetical protein